MIFTPIQNLISLLKVKAIYKNTCSSFLALFVFFTTSEAGAHVKWFAPYDVNKAPKPFGDVLTDSFWTIGVLSFIIVFLSAWLDRAWTTADKQMEKYRQLVLQNVAQGYELRAFRYTLIIFFTAIWTLGNVILTPELKHDSVLIGGLHLLMIISLLFDRTARFAGYGIFILWLYSTYHYGIFHLSDYIIFLGIATFIILASTYPHVKNPQRRFAILYGAIAITLLWASIEKFVYPHWSYPLLERLPHLTMGLTKESFMDLAGFGEFALAFLLISVSGISFVMTCLVLAGIFISAIYDFGKIDAIGHLAIIVSLFIMPLHGPSTINRWFSRLHTNPAVNAFYVTLIYGILLLLFFVLYYAIRKLWLLTLAH
jgi:hypothetical protein